MAPIVGGNHPLGTGASGPIVITSVGAAAGLGWVPAFQVPASRIDSGEKVIVVTGRVGAVTPRTANIVNATCEIAVGDQNGPNFQDYGFRFQVADQTLWNFAPGTALAEALPFFFLIPVTNDAGITPDRRWGTSWNGSDTLTLWARIFSNGDPSNIQAEFQITDVMAQWWNLDLLAGRYHLEEFWPGVPETSAIVTEPWKDIWGTANPVGAVGETWLHYWGITFDPLQQPGQAGGASGFRLGFYNPFPTFTPYVGTWRWSAYPRGTGQFGGRFVQYNMGAWFAAVRPSGTNFAPAVQARDFHQNGNQRTSIQKIRYFGIRGSSLTGWSMRSTQEVPAGTNPSIGSQANRWSFNPAIYGPTFYVTMFYSIVKTVRRTEYTTAIKQAALNAFLWVSELSVSQRGDLAEAMSHLAIGDLAAATRGSSPTASTCSTSRTQGRPPR